MANTNDSEPQSHDDETEKVMHEIGEASAILKRINSQLAELIDRGIDINDANLLDGLLDAPLEMLDHIKESNPNWQNAFEQGLENTEPEPPKKRLRL